MLISANLRQRIIPVYGIILLFLSLAGISVQGQQYYFDNYHVEEGLTQSKIYTILQSRKHHIWLGTLSGVSRFDGLSFQNFTSEDGMAENSVRAICEDKNGNIWFGHNEGGITRYNGKKFENIPAGYLLNKDVTSITENDKGELWITSAGAGALLISNPNNSFKNLKIERFSNNRLSNHIYSSYKLRNGSVLFITNTGIKKYFPTKNTCVDFAPPQLPSKLDMTAMCEDLQGNLWFGTHQKGLYKYSPSEKKITIYDKASGISSNIISYLLCDKKGNVWVGTWGGGITVIPAAGKIKVYNTGNGLQDDYIWKIIEDTEGNILIGTTAHGLSIFKGEYMVNFAQPNSLLNKQVSAILQDHEKNIWFGTDNGIIIYNPKNSSETPFARYNAENSIISNQIRFLKKDKNENIWVGTEESGVFMYDKARRSFINLPSLNSLLPEDKGVTSLEIDRKNNLWIGTSEGLIYYSIESKTGNRFTTLNGLAGDYITALYCTKNSLVIGSKGKGIAIFNDSSRLVYQLNNFETPLSFVEGKDGVLWIGTESHGLLGFKNGKTVKHYGIKEGLLSNLVNFVNCDGNGNIYCGTNKGLNKIEVATNKIYIYTRKNGYYGIESKKNATFTDADGYIWFGTVNGAVRYAPWLDQPSTLQPLTHIFRFRVNQADFDIRPGVVLKSSQNSIIFDYISICLTNPDAVQYQVKLEGIDKDWQPVTNQTSIAYPVLPPNKYEFKVRARNSAGIWNTVPAFFSFEISPPFYKRWYFVLGLVGSLVVFLVVYIKLREHNLIVEKNVLENKVKARTYEVMNINEELAMKNKDVVASIQYARRIQLSVLPSAIPFDNTFVLFKPKDIVSGDFFWFMEDETYQWMAAVDCTGHGVPGAFMSLIGYNSLNKIVREMQITLPSDILNQLNEELTKTLHQNAKESTISDGMDISLIRYNKNTHVLDFSGAFNSLWIVRKRELLELRADRFAIGRTPHINKAFSNDSTQLQSDDTIYLFTDGYADQFGGPDNKKYKVYKFKELIINIQQYSMQKQREMLEENIEKWRGKEIQVDDILVIGRKFKF